MKSGSQILLFLRFCRAPDCRAMFVCCSSCNRGQVYCGDSCRAPARLRQRRSANQRYQDTLRGRLAHSRRQHDYRKRQAARQQLPDQNKVTDHSSNADLLVPPSRRVSSPYWANGIFLTLLRAFCPANGFSVCQFCGCRGRFFIDT